MADIKKRVLKIASGAEEKLDDLLNELKIRLRLNDPLQIIPYRTYGTVNDLFVKGRVLEDKKIGKGAADDRIWKNIMAMYQRFESDEIGGATIKITFEGKDHLVTTNREGYFTLHLRTEVPVRWEDMWHEVSLELVEAPVPFEKGLKTTAEVLVPPSDAEFGIISDIDDTIVRTSATNLLSMSRNTFFHNAHTRLPFAGVAEFYKALLLGRNGKRNNPFFYVSSSPWNLYDLLTDFMDLNDIPPGPLLLRDFGLEPGKPGTTDHMGHKFGEIKSILERYPNLNFVLIGDSGQEDPRIYREVVKQFPGRILTIYIRDVQLKERETIALTISKELAQEKVEMIIVDNTVEAAEHAARTGLIFSQAISSIEKDKQLDKGETPGKEEMS